MPQVRPERPDAGMCPISTLYKCGRGPSSSHTIGPERICRYFLKKYPEADSFRVILYGSLALTGKGHGTDRVIRETFDRRPVEIALDASKEGIEHPNTMELFAYRDGAPLGSCRALSVGGGEIRIQGEPDEGSRPVYPHRSFEEIAAFCRESDMRLWEYAERFEGAGLRGDMLRVWREMQSAVERGLEAGGLLPGGLGVARKARQLFTLAPPDESAEARETRLVSAYAFAVGEENAAGGRVVTAPTCGAAGVLPAVLYHYRNTRGCTDEDMIRALETGGIVGNLIRTNASVSGAECGCQAEIGSACSMAAASLGELLGLNIDQIEYAAEIAMEHHLGLTCDPIGGLVQIPCIERNAVAATRAIDSVTLARFLSGSRKISFDRVIKTMYETGLDISSRYKETSQAGLAKLGIK